jgi:hypothetical protein
MLQETEQSTIISQVYGLNLKQNTNSIVSDMNILASLQKCLHNITMKYSIGIANCLNWIELASCECSGTILLLSVAMLVFYKMDFHDHLGKYTLL